MCESSVFGFSVAELDSLGNNAFVFWIEPIDWLPLFQDYGRWRHFGRVCYCLSVQIVEGGASSRSGYVCLHMVRDGLMSLSRGFTALCFEL
jgi:hypothetical protein